VLIDEVLRSSAQIVQRQLAGVDPHVVIQRREDVAVVYRAVGGDFAQEVGRADDLAGCHAAAGQQATVGVGPMITARVAVNFR